MLPVTGPTAIIHTVTRVLSVQTYTVYFNLPQQTIWELEKRGHVIGGAGMMVLADQYLVWSTEVTEVSLFRRSALPVGREWENAISSILSCDALPFHPSQASNDLTVC